MTSPKAVVFDIGNVLIHWQPERLYARLIPDANARSQFFEKTGLLHMNEEIDRGAPFRETVEAKAAAFPEHADLIMPWHDQWTEMAHAIIPQTLKVIRALKAQDTPVFALSNFGADTFEFALTVYPELAEFDRHFISGRLKVTKPDPRIYEIVETETGLSGADLVFFDDLPANIEVAKNRGWRAQLFTQPEKMITDLGDMGLIHHNMFV